MKKAFIYNKVWTLALGAMALTACSDFLDQPTDERTEIDSEKKVVQLMGSAYPTCSFMWLSEIYSDNIIDNTAPHMPTSPSASQTLSHYNYSSYARWDEQAFRFEPATMATYSDWDSPGVMWESYYNSIASVNHALVAIDKLVEENGGKMSNMLKAAKAEGLMIRAYSHFMLAQLFCQAYKDDELSKNDVGIPYVTEVEENVRKNYDRGNVTDTYKKIQADLEAALPEITDQLYDKPKWHFNTNAAHAFAARFYLTTRQYAKVIEHANAVLGEDPASSASMTMDYSLFTSDLATLSEYGKVWQNPNTANNLMLMATYSVHNRRTFGYRYSCAGPAARAAFMYHTNSSLYSGYYLPAIMIAGFTAASSSTQDYGMTTSRLAEEFEYSDKIAGIGYPHMILMPFTASVLLLERAEAKTMLGRYDDAAQDLMAFWNNPINTFNEEQKKSYFDTGYMKLMTPDVITGYYAKENKQNVNILADWSFTSRNVSPTFNVPAEAVPYMNCINDFRRWETVLMGMRFFDLKRWGMEWEHQFAEGKQTYSMKMEGNDPRRAIEVPWEVISAGMQPSRSTTYDNRVLVEIKEGEEPIAPIE